MECDVSITPDRRVTATLSGSSSKCSGVHRSSKLGDMNNTGQKEKNCRLYFLATRKRSRWWTFTANEPQFPGTWSRASYEYVENTLDSICEVTKSTFGFAGDEIGGEKERPHWQGGIYFESSVGLKTACERIAYIFLQGTWPGGPPLWLEAVKAPAALERYCKKDGKWLEWGEAPAQG